MSVFTSMHSLNAKTRVDLASPQMALILAAERVLQAAGLWLVCPTCAKELGTYKHLVTNNGPEDAVWKIDCPCTERRFPREGLQHSMSPSGDLLKLAETLLTGTKLAIRCPVKVTGCLTTPLDITMQTGSLTARCQCWQIKLGAGVYRFTKTEQAA